MDVNTLDKIKVLVVDDSAFMRKLISDMLSEDSGIEVVDTARDGLWAVEKLKTQRVDVVTMDVNMPRMNGLEALKKINETFKVPVIMLSSLTGEGEEITIKALEFGAFDFVLKPSSDSASIGDIRDELIGKIKLCMQSKLNKEREGRIIPALNTIRKYSSIGCVCIASSTGGPKALTRLVPEFPEGFDIPVLIVQHMPAGFTKAFADRLNGLSNIRVKEAVDGEKITGGTAYIAPGGYHMVVRSGGFISLNTEPQLHGVRPCADKMFISAAQNMEGKLIGVVLTGMGRDGTDGLMAIKERGGICIAEDESTCTVFGMPKSAIERGVVHIVSPIQNIAGEILGITGFRGVKHGE
jgi:Chemotaxis response regulator containing a CheY-like receiver domain and a methylesterase domain